MKLVFLLSLLLNFSISYQTNACNYTKIFPSLEYTFFLDKSGNVYASGANYSGQIGLGEEKTIDSVKKVPLLSNIVNIFSKLNTTFFIDENNKIFICGNNIGNIAKNAPYNILSPLALELNIVVKQIAHSSKYILFIDENNDVYAYGDNQYGQLGLGEEKYVNNLTKIPNLKDIVDAKTYNDSSLFLDKNGDVYGCGYNEFGQLGYGEAKTQIKNIFKLPLADIKKIELHTSALFLNNNGKVYACGANHKGQLHLRGLWVNSATKIKKLSNIKDIFLGFENTFFIDNNFTAYIGNKSLFNNVKLLITTAHELLIIDLNNQLFSYNLRDKVPVLKDENIRLEDLEQRFNTTKKALP